jgi:hypothetical protein
MSFGIWGEFRGSPKPSADVLAPLAVSERQPGEAWVAGKECRDQNTKYRGPLRRADPSASALQPCIRPYEKDAKYWCTKFYNRQNLQLFTRTNASLL